MRDVSFHSLLASRLRKDLFVAVCVNPVNFFLCYVIFVVTSIDTDHSDGLAGCIVYKYIVS